MNKKLTLSLNETVIRKAKVYAESTGSSLSGLVEDYFEKLISQKSSTDISESLKNLAGKIELPESFDQELVRREITEEKHLK